MRVQGGGRQSGRVSRSRLGRVAASFLFSLRRPPAPRSQPLRPPPLRPYIQHAHRFPIMDRVSVLAGHLAGARALKKERSHLSRPPRAVALGTHPHCFSPRPCGRPDHAVAGRSCALPVLPVIRINRAMGEGGGVGCCAPWAANPSSTRGPMGGGHSRRPSSQPPHPPAPSLAQARPTAPSAPPPTRLPLP